MSLSKTPQAAIAGSCRQKLVTAWIKIVFGGSGLFLALSIVKNYL
jgi:hypothetical protein